MSTAHILLVEDEADAAAEIERLLTSNGWQVTVCADGEEGLREAARRRFDLIIADRNMPRRDGVSMLARLRELGVVAPAIMLSALHETDHRVEGLDAGADDYLAKPFEALELFARARALMRRTAFNSHDEVMTLGDLEIFVNTGAVKRGGEALNLTKGEFKLLKFLADRSPETVTPRMILEGVLGWRAADDPEGPNVPVAIHRLRSKVDRDREPMLETVRGVGYRLVAPGSTD